MHASSLRLRLLLLAAPAIHGCGASSAETGQGATPPTATGPTQAATAKPTAGPQSSPGEMVAPSPGAQAWMAGGLVCVTAAHSRHRFGPGAAPPFAACQDWPDDDFARSQLGSLPCGPCSFAFVPEATRQMRQQRPDACCYRPGSPPDPGEIMIGRPLVVEAHLRQAALVTGPLGWSV